MKVIYRISDSGQSKIKPEYITKRGCFLHFMKVFGEYEIYIIADNVGEETYTFLTKYVKPERITRTQLHNAKSFLYSVRFAIEHFGENDSVYLAEDDYLYTPNAPGIIEEGLGIGDYSTGYDHPDKFLNTSIGLNGGNPLIRNGGEVTFVLLSESSHWKITNSTTMTFATKVKYLKEDYPIYEKYCQNNIPGDFAMFLELARNNKRKLVSPLPGVSTHGETAWLSRLTDWSEQIKNRLIE